MKHSLKNCRAALLLLIAIVLKPDCRAQQLIPFPDARGKYGYSLPSGVTVTPPQFKKAWLPTRQGLTLALDTTDRLHVVRHDGTVLPASVVYKTWSEPMVELVTNTVSSDAHPDTLPDFFCIRSTDGKEFLLAGKGPNGWESRTYFSYEQLQSEVPIYGKYFYENYVSGPLAFYKGLHPVIKGKSRLNFINTNLKELFPVDYANGVILKNGFIALASPEGRFALADAQGKIGTGFLYRSITSTARPDAFVVNGFPGRYSAHNGLIRTDGSIMLDTIYEYLEGVSGDWVVARKNNKSGVLDYQGNTVLPFVYEHLEYTRGGYFIGSENGQGMNIINISGAPLLEKPWYNIRYVHNWNSNALPYYELIDGPNSKMRGVLDSNLNLVFMDSISQIRMEYRKFMVTDAKGKTFGLYDYTGRRLIPVAYSFLERTRDTSGYLVMKDSLFGFYTFEGVQALPCRYSRISFEQAGDSLILWANAHRNKNLYAAFNPKGWRLPIPEQIAPSLRTLEHKNCFVPEMEKGQWKLTLPDGSFVYKPQDYPYKNKNIGTPDGCLMVEFENGRANILDAYLKPIIPKGFTLSEQQYRGPYIKMGLIPVYGNGQSGIIDTRGNWVQKPGPYQYHILRPNIYSEHKGTPGEYNPSGATICTITPEGLQKTEVDYMNDKFRDGYLVIARKMENPPAELLNKSYDGTVYLYALMDTFGRVTTPFMFSRFPEPRGSRWAAQVYAEDYSVKYVVTDFTGRIWLDYSAEPIEYYEAERHWVHFTGKDGRTGIRDTLGREILPAQYIRLFWKIPGKLFTSELADGKWQLCTADGQAVLTGFQYLNRFDTLPGNTFYVAIDDMVHLLSPEFQVSHSIPGKEVQLVPDYPDLLQVKTAEGHLRYVNYRKGIVYRE